jgi:hypothetical protein
MFIWTFLLDGKYITKEQREGYTKRYDILGKKINRYMQYVENSYLNPMEKIAEGTRIADNLASDYVIDK